MRLKLKVLFFLLFLFISVANFSWLVLMDDGEIYKGELLGIKDNAFLIENENGDEFNLNLDNVVLLINEEQSDLNTFFLFTDQNGDFPTFMLKDGEMLVFKIVLLEISDTTYRTKIWDNYALIFENLNRIFLNTSVDEINMDYVRQKFEEGINAVFNTSLVSNVWLQYTIQK